MKKIGILLAGICSLSSFCFAQTNSTESLTISTYYPSPYGVYRNLRLNPSQAPATGVGAGLMYFNATDDNLKIYTNTSGWVNVTGGVGSGYWVENATTHDIYNTNVKGVGIGTPHPGADLEVSNSTNQASIVINGHGGSVGGTYSQLALLRTDSDWLHNSWNFAFKSAPQNSLVIQRQKVDGSTAIPFVIDQNGKVGIGTTAPQAALDVNGTVRANNANGAGFVKYETNAFLHNYHNSLAPGWPANTNELMFTIAACNRRCGNGCVPAMMNCSGTQPGLGYHGGTAVEWSGVGVTCACF